MDWVQVMPPLPNPSELNIRRKQAPLPGIQTGWIKSVPFKYNQICLSFQYTPHPSFYFYKQPIKII